jgi:hypothetical protein
VPYGDDPDRLALDSIKEPVRRDENLSIGQLREFRDQASRLRIPTEPSEHVLGPQPELPRRLGVVAVNVRQGRQKLKAA